MSRRVDVPIPAYLEHMHSRLFLAAAIAALTTGTPRRPEVTIHFSATVGSLPLACGRSYDSVGTASTKLTPTALRLYVYDIRLTRGDGTEVSVILEPGSAWQSQGVALLAFPAGPAPCDPGDRSFHTEVVGQVPAGNYAGLRFSVGVPWLVAQRPRAGQPAPLSDSAMMLPGGGYPLLRLDYLAGDPPEPRTLRLGGNATREVRFISFDPQHDSVVLDLGVLLAGADLTQPTLAEAPVVAALNGAGEVFRAGRGEVRPEPAIPGTGQ
jgi:hypothetical protein